MRREKSRLFVFLLLSIIPLSLCFGGDERSGPAEVYLMFDGSLSMQNSQEKAAEWVSEYIAGKILQEKDSLTIWSVADVPVLEFSGVIGSQEDTDTIKTILSSITLKSSAGNYRAAFNELQKKIIPNSQYTYAYVILVTGISGRRNREYVTVFKVDGFPRMEGYDRWAGN